VLRQRAQDAGAPAPKLVALTALASASDVQRAQDAGFDAHLAKPVDAEALLRLCAALAAQGPPARAA
jgi:CheY-like chemotaxis protein